MQTIKRKDLCLLIKSDFIQPTVNSNSIFNLIMFRRFIAPKVNSPIRLSKTRKVLPNSQYNKSYSKIKKCKLKAN